MQVDIDDSDAEALLNLISIESLLNLSEEPKPEKLDYAGFCEKHADRVKMWMHDHTKKINGEWKLTAYPPIIETPDGYVWLNRAERRRLR